MEAGLLLGDCFIIREVPGVDPTSETGRDPESTSVEGVSQIGAEKPGNLQAQ